MPLTFNWGWLELSARRQGITYISWLTLQHLFLSLPNYGLYYPILRLFRGLFSLAISETTVIPQSRSIKLQTNSPRQTYGVQIFWHPNSSTNSTSLHFNSTLFPFSTHAQTFWTLCRILLPVRPKAFIVCQFVTDILLIYDFSKWAAPKTPHLTNHHLWFLLLGWGRYTTFYPEKIWAAQKRSPRLRQKEMVLVNFTRMGSPPIKRSPSRKSASNSRQRRPWMLASWNQRKVDASFFFRDFGWFQKDQVGIHQEKSGFDMLNFEPMMISVSIGVVI